MSYPIIEKSVCVGNETTYGVQAIATNCQFIQPTRDGFSLTNTNNAIDPDYMRDDMRKTSIYSAFEGGEAVVKMPVRGNVGTNADGDASEFYAELEPLIKACAGTTVNDTTDDIVTDVSNSTTTAYVTDASAFTVGAIAGIKPTSASDVQPRQLTVVDTSSNYVSWTRAVDAVCDNSGTVYGFSNILPSHVIDDSVTLQSQTAVVGSNLKYELMLGGRGNISIPEVTAQAQVFMQFDLMFDSYTVDEDTTAPITTGGGASGIPSVANQPAEIVAKNWTLKIDGVSTPFVSFSFDAANNMQEKPDSTGSQGRAGYELTDMAPALTVKTYWSDTLRAAYDATTKHDVLIYGGIFPDQFAIAAGNCQITEAPDSDTNGLTTMDLSFRIADPAENGLSSDVYEWAIGLAGYLA